MSSRRLHIRNLRPDRDAFKKLVASIDPTSRLLGVTHVTTGYILREALDEGALRAYEPCELLKLPLLYAFYGRAAFRRNDDETPTDLTFRLPVVFILAPSHLPKPKYVFAFDTGAFMTGLLDDYLDPYMPLFDFHLEPDISTGARIARYFFGSSESYLANRPIDDIRVPPSAFEVESYKRLLLGGGAPSQISWMTGVQPSS
jgi:hypothetical protein